MTGAPQIAAPAPPRVERLNPVGFTLTFAAAAFVIWSLTAAGPSVEQLARGLPNIGNILGRMFPPDLARIDRILLSLFQTFQMAVAGCVLGLILSVPLGILAAEGLSPHPKLRTAVRSLIAVFRTVPDLVWALIFVIAVGLGSPAGVLAIAIDVMGFAGRFFAEAMEETDKGPREAMTAIGASRTGMIMSAVLPLALPSMIATSLYCLEKATRASVVLGLVGAGGIGVELKVAFDLFAYQTASTIILLILLLVIAVEQTGGWLRRRII
ncbi:MAG: phosphonate ABC transporter, permease protein PhnE [Beijerinckiaceae bacterium]